MTQKRPNLVFVFPDQFRQQAIGYMEQNPVVTPNLDRFASESIVFTNSVSNYPVCSPYRAMLFTRKYPHSVVVPESSVVRIFNDGDIVAEIIPRTLVIKTAWFAHQKGIFAPKQ